ncbi:class II fructose-bisphosphate aldolase [Pelosinus sp. UFO1]|uniref:class II fructose-bisphosphate aldolase n=1 Tax=Pelosinus sp. UFO1 TaxID=484770 RepID=UPI0004D1AF5E|nr:class II fructose-bisphosphate aldolase [Pelosinus sp. UFO1]AIF51419.1 ketose-bisphosphate aldolase [Pelosinus sp. UFO1]
MALVTMNDLLQDARNRKYAVGGFNVFNLETLCAVVEVAEELKTPLVLGITERFFKFVDVDTLSAAMVRAAQKSSVPIALHLDHGYTYEGIIKAIRWGFTSVMFDGSSLSVVENLKRTKEVTRIAHSLGVSVEGELGYVGCCEHAEDINEDNIVTCDVAANFVDKTNIDALAVSVGNHHGAYRGTTNLNIARLSQLNSVINVPLVMHGGSRLSSDDYLNSIKYGITKINIPTDTSMAASEKLRTELLENPGANYISLMSAVKKGVKNSVRKYMLHFNCISKAI